MSTGLRWTNPFLHDLWVISKAIAIKIATQYRSQTGCEFSVVASLASVSSLRLELVLVLME